LCYTAFINSVLSERMAFFFGIFLTHLLVVKCEFKLASVFLSCRLVEWCLVLFTMCELYLSFRCLLLLAVCMFNLHLPFSK